MNRRFVNPALVVLLSWGLASVRGGLPAEWMGQWSDPTAELRPLQILHGVGAQQASPAGMATLKSLGLGGIVCNVDFDKYMVSEGHWETLIQAVDACREVGLWVWIYDEKGYPSGSAGGLVLQRDSEYEALALTYDPSRSEPFTLRPAYEHTHASNNFHAARRYPNLIDDKAVRSFIEITHQAYWQRLAEHFGKTVRAVFTDEPSLMAVNIGQLPENVRKNVRVVDAVDANIAPLPLVPWVRDLPKSYRRRYGEDIMAVRRSLFEGSSETDRQVRRRFWALVSDLIAERYFGRIQKWASAHSIASSGHTLWEEMPLHHVPLHGNALKALGRMDIPGLDMLSSDPEAVIHTGWLTASLPGSAALFNGGRRVMTEVSDFSQKMAGKGPASLVDMQATAGWQAALGVTEFTLYYGRHERKAEEYWQYCTFVGRLNAVLRKSEPATGVLLYYPIYDLWGEYVPVAQKLTLESQTERARRIVKSFMELGQQMVRRQISFALIDHELLTEAKVRGAGISVRGHQFRALVLPAEVELPKSVAEIVERFRSSGGKVLSPGVAGPGIDLDPLVGVYANGTLAVPSDRIVVGRFRRQGRDILLVVNVGGERYVGEIAGDKQAQWWVGHPDSGRIEPATVGPGGRISVTLPPRGAILLIGASADKDQFG